MPLFSPKSRNKRNAIKELEADLSLRTRYGNKRALFRLGKRTLTLSLYVLIACLLLLGIYLGGKKLLERGDQFQLQFVKFSTNGVITQAQALELMGLKGGENLIALDTEELSNKLLAAPGISNARVMRELPDTLSIELEARLPVVWLECKGAKLFAQDEENGLFLDASATCFSFTPGLHDAYRNIPILRIATPESGSVKSGDQLNTVLPAMHLMKIMMREPEDVVPRVLLIEMPNAWSLALTLQGGTVATFGLFDHEQQIDRLILALNNARRTNRRILTVNLIPSRGTPVLFEQQTKTFPAPASPPTSENRASSSSSRR